VTNTTLWQLQSYSDVQHHVCVGISSLHGYTVLVCDARGASDGKQLYILVAKLPLNSIHDFVRLMCDVYDCNLSVFSVKLLLTYTY